MFRRLNRTAAVILTRGDYFLLSQRTNTEAFSGYHQFPGGREDSPDETPVDIAWRELLEETGLDLERIRFIHLGNNPYDTDCNSCDMFHVEVEEDEEPQYLEPHKHTPWEWMSIECIRGLKLIDGVLEFVEKIWQNKRLTFAQGYLR